MQADKYFKSLHGVNAPGKPALLQALIDSQQYQAPLELTAIRGGVINGSYVLHTGSTKYFLKTFACDRIIPFDRHSVFTLQAHMATEGLAPTPVQLCTETGFQVEEWVQHVPLDKLDVSQQEKLHTLAHTLWQVHQQQVDMPALMLPDEWQNYLSMLSANEAARYLDVVRDASEVWHETQRDAVICHNDLAMAHVATGAKPVVFDWEYAALGNRYFDLASCAKVNNLSEPDCQALCEAYAQVSGFPLRVVEQGVSEQMSLVELTNMLWYAAVNTLSDQASA